MHTYIHTYIPTYLYTYIHSYIHTYIQNSLTGHVSAYMFDVLPWLPLQQRIMFRIGGGVSWVLLRPTSEIFAVQSRAPEVAVHSAHRNRGYSLFLLLIPPQPRPVHYRWLEWASSVAKIAPHDSF